MQPFKNGQVVSKWLLRISLVLYLFLGNVNRISPIDFQSVRFYLSLALVVFSVLLLVGGFISKPGLTVISGLFIFLISAYHLFVLFRGSIDFSFTLYLLPLSIGFFFVCNGNK